MIKTSLQKHFFFHPFLFAQGDALETCLQYYEHELMDLAVQCPVVVVCRCSPTQVCCSPGPQHHTTPFSSAFYMFTAIRNVL